MAELSGGTVNGTRMTRMRRIGADREEGGMAIGKLNHGGAEARRRGDGNTPVAKSARGEWFGAAAGVLNRSSVTTIRPHNSGRMVAVWFDMKTL